MKLRFKEMAALIAAFAAGGALNAQITSVAYGFCSQPYAPTTFLSKPNKPYCATNRNCSDWEVENYRTDVERYYRDLGRYANEVDQYYSDAVDYVGCMRDLD